MTACTAMPGQGKKERWIYRRGRHQKEAKAMAY